MPKKEAFNQFATSAVFAGLSVATGGLFNETTAQLLNSLLSNVASHYLVGGGEKMRQALNDPHARQNTANHDLQKGFRNAIKAALEEIKRAYCEKNIEEATRQQVADFLQELQKAIIGSLPPFNESLTEVFLQNYLKDQDAAKAQMQTSLAGYVETAERIDQQFQSYFVENLQPLVQLYFGEILKDSQDKNVKVWKAYQKMQLDGIRENQVLTQLQLQTVLAKLEGNEMEVKLSAALETTIQSLQYRMRLVIEDLRSFRAVLEGMQADVREIKETQKAHFQQSIETDVKVEIVAEGQVKTHEELAAIKKSIATSSNNSIPKHLTTAAFRTEVFLGRTEDLQAIEQRLWQNQNPNVLLLVNGRGGMGKTTLASEYYHRNAHRYQHLAWVFAERSIADALLTLAVPLQIHFAPTETTDQRLARLLQALQNLEAPCLLVIDNANKLTDLQQYYKALRTCSNFHLLLTTRITTFRQAATYAIEALPEAQAIQLFQTHYPKHQTDENPLLKGILQAVDSNTLVVELLAKNLHRLNRLRTHYQLQDLLHDLQNKGLLQLSQSKEVAADYQHFETAKAETIIAAMYDLGELSEAEKALLAVFAVLPAENIEFEILEELLNSTPDLDEILLKLSQKGWLDMESDNETAVLSFRISPDIQEVCRDKHGNLLKDCGQLIDKLNDLLSYGGGIGHLEKVSYQKASLLVSYAESIFLSLEEVNSGVYLLCEKMGSYFNATGNLEKTLHYFLHYSSLAKQLMELYPENQYYKNSLAISYSKLGETHSSLGNLEQALNFFEEDAQLTKELYEAYPSNVGFKNGLAISYSKLGSTHSSLGNLEQALNFFEQRSRLGKELYEAYPSNVGFKNGLAISYAKLGFIYRDQKKDLQQARFYLELVEKHCRELCGISPLNVAFQGRLRAIQQMLREL
ncbi:MAG: NB-ARC domain-containing protein [Chitinophagales bacterium]